MDKKLELEPITFGTVAMEIAIAVGAAIAKEIATPLINDALGKKEVDYNDIYIKALKDIAMLVREAIDDAFLDEYLADCRHVTDQLRLYADTQDVDILKNMQDRSGSLAYKLHSKGMKGLGGLAIACNLHLLTLRGLAEKDKNYLDHLARKFTEYAGWLNELGEKMIFYFLGRVSVTCTCIVYLEHDYMECESPWVFQYDWGKWSREFRDKSECDEARRRDKELYETPGIILGQRCRGMAFEYEKNKIYEEE